MSKRGIRARLLYTVSIESACVVDFGVPVVRTLWASLHRLTLPFGSAYDSDRSFRTANHAHKTPANKQKPAVAKAKKAATQKKPAAAKVKKATPSKKVCVV